MRRDNGIAQRGGGRVTAAPNSLDSSGCGVDSWLVREQLEFCARTSFEPIVVYLQPEVGPAGSSCWLP
jgi:hypothetical protein